MLEFSKVILREFEERLKCMRPTHNPQFKDALPPASSYRLDGRATDAITRQLDRLNESVGDVNEARIPHQENEERLYGYNLGLSNGAAHELTVEVNAAGEPDGDDREFVDARNRLAVLRSRERSRGSRRFNFAYMLGRGNGPGGHGYQLRRAQREYNEALSDFVARKIDGLALGNEDLVTEAVSRSIIQEQKQMSALENMAAEQKSSTRFLNFFRNHKKLRFAAGLALSAIGTVGVATGQLEIAIPAFAARSALGAVGGYLLGRTAWDAVQGRRAKRLPDDDVRMVSTNNGDFSGRLTPRAAFQRIVKLYGAEARAGSHDPRRQQLIQRLGSGLVHDYFTDQLSFTAGLHGHTEIENQVTSLYQGIINNPETERLESDQTQSRKRHIAGLAGGILFGALLPGVRTVGLIGGIDIGGHGSPGANAIGHHGGSRASGSGTLAHPHTKIGAGKPSISTESGPANGSGPGSEIAGSHAPTSLPNGSRDISIAGNNDTVLVGLLPEVAGHAHHGLGLHDLHEALGGVSIGELHVESGGGFISTLQEQYHLTPAQAEATYQAMYSHLYGMTGTYLDGSDIRISAPGTLKLTRDASTILEEKLREFHKLPGQIHTGNSVVNTITQTEGKITGSKSIDATNLTNGSMDITINGNHDTVLVSGLPNESVDLQAIVDSHYVQETGIGSLTPEQAIKAQVTLEDYIHNGGFSGSHSAKEAAQKAILNYAQASVEGPATPGTQNESMWIRHLLMAMHHNFLTTMQAEKLEENLAIVNAGR